MPLDVTVRERKKKQENREVEMKANNKMNIDAKTKERNERKTKKNRISITWLNMF